MAMYSEVSWILGKQNIAARSKIETKWSRAERGISG